MAERFTREKKRADDDFCEVNRDVGLFVQMKIHAKRNL